MISLSDRILETAPQSLMRKPKPPWLRARLPGGPGYQRLRRIVDTNRLHTVCESARCPNMGECWSRGTATLMILGDVCTRSCGFCHVTTGRPEVLDLDEPRRVGKAAQRMGLRHIVVTSVNRDELEDGGAGVWARTIREIRRQAPRTTVEVLIPDFCGRWESLDRVLDARPDILNHNMETVRRLYPVVRPQAKYDRSIELLARAREAGLVTKTGIMVGIGEKDEEVSSLMRDLRRRAGTDILTIGQYLQPSLEHLPVARWVSPPAFESFKRAGEQMGFRHVESGPLVRSSYHAEEQALQFDGSPDVANAVADGRTRSRRSACGPASPPEGT